METLKKSSLTFSETKNEKWPLLRILALGRSRLPASRGITTSLYGTAFVHPATAPCVALPSHIPVGRLHSMIFVLLHFSIT